MLQTSNSSYSPLLGLILGLTYMFFELPNSYVKRLMGIPPGEKPARFGAGFTLLDKSDSTFGVCLVYSIFANFSFIAFAIMFFSAFCVHLSLSKVLVSLRLKDSL